MTTLLEATEIIKNFCDSTRCWECPFYTSHCTFEDCPNELDIAVLKERLEEYASGERKDDNTDTEGICPVCGGVIIYNGGMDRDDSGGTYPWECVYCGSTGKEGFDFHFDRHYDVRDAQGNPIPGRPE